MDVNNKHVFSFSSNIILPFLLLPYYYDGLAVMCASKYMPLSLRIVIVTKSIRWITRQASDAAALINGTRDFNIVIVCIHSILVCTKIVYIPRVHISVFYQNLMVSKQSWVFCIVARLNIVD